MVKVQNIVSINNNILVCELNNGEFKKIDLSELISNHKHLIGIDKLKDIQYQKTAKIGEFGEIFWENTIHSNNEVWNYDISPEYILHQGITIVQDKLTS